MTVPEAYERLLLDAMRGDQTLFTRRDEVEAAWKIVDSILKGTESPEFPPPHPYPAGTWGPPPRNSFSPGRASVRQFFLSEEFLASRSRRVAAADLGLRRAHARFDHRLRPPGASSGSSRKRGGGERGGRAPESVCTLNLIAIFFNAGQYGARGRRWRWPARSTPAGWWWWSADPLIEQESLTASASVSPIGRSLTIERLVLSRHRAGDRHLESAMMGLCVPTCRASSSGAGAPMAPDAPRGGIGGPDHLRLGSEAGRLPGGDREAAREARAPSATCLGAHLPWQALAADTLDLPNLREHRAISAGAVICAGAVGAEGLLLLGWMQSPDQAPPGGDPGGGEPEPEEDTALNAAAPPGRADGSRQVKALEFEAPTRQVSLRREKGILVGNVKGERRRHCANRRAAPAGHARPAPRAGAQLAL